MYSYEDVRLDKLDRHQLPLLLALKKESWFGTHRVTICNLTNQVKWFESLDNDPHTPKNLFMIASIGREVGLFKFDFDWQNRRASVGWDVFTEYRNHGYGKKIVKCGVMFSKDVLQLNRLRCEILSTNEASQKCAISAGFKQEGIEPKAVLKGNEWIDSHYFGLNFPLNAST